MRVVAKPARMAQRKRTEHEVPMRNGRHSPPLRVAVLGGGTGLSSLLTGLKHYTKEITAVVTVTDEGGSSGWLRRAWGVLPPGDLRNCLVALAEDDALLSRLFQYRFPARGGRRASGIGMNHSLEGHALGNLFLAALTEVAGGFDRAIAAASHVLAIRGRVLPVTLEKVRLQARLANGRRVLGEPRISRSRSRIQRVALTPAAPPPSEGVLKSILEADLIVLGPGSLYTSVIPPLLVSGVAEALSEASALKIYICNVMTQPGETGGYSAADHLKAVLDHCPTATGRPVVDVMLANSEPFSKRVLDHYARSNAFPVLPPAQNFIHSVRVARRPLGPSLSQQTLTAATQARHSPALLARAVMDLFKVHGRNA